MKKFFKTITAVALTLTLALALAPVSKASVFTFNDVEGSLPGTMALNVGGSGNLAVLTFTNSDTLASSLTNIYFDFGTTPEAFGSVNVMLQSPGVDFLDNTGNVIPSSPVAMPGWDTVGFNTLYSIQADKQGGMTHNGVNGGELLALALNLNQGYDVNWLVSALGSGDVNIGIHALSIGEEELSATGMTATPIPAAAWLLGSGLLGMVGLRSRMNQ